jgi:hypothetical protein
MDDDRDIIWFEDWKESETEREHDEAELHDLL